MVNDVDKYCRDGAHDYKCCACIENVYIFILAPIPKIVKIIWR